MAEAVARPANSVIRRANAPAVAPVRSHTLRVAIVHDDLTQRGGAERVVLSLHRLFPDAPIYATVYDPEGTYPEFAELDVRSSFLQRLPHRGGRARALLPFYPAAVRTLRLRGYDLVVSSSSRFAHGTRTPGAFHLCYCYNPPRWLHQADEYFADGGPVPAKVRPLLAPVLGWLRRWDRAASRRPDLYVAISRTVADRIKSVYGREARVVRPPLDLSRFRPVGPTESVAPYYLMVSRLLPYKRVDLAVQACAARGSRLVVVGSGPAEQTLRRLAGPTVEFRSGLNEVELTELLANCVAVVQPGLEDLGFAPLEANACGRPALAYAAGGALETVVDGVTGVHFGEQSVASLVAAMDRVEASLWDGDILRTHAATMGEERFHRELIGVLAEVGMLNDTEP